MSTRPSSAGGRKCLRAEVDRLRALAARGLQLLHQDSGFPE
jgi:hypothetical protein